MSRQITALYDTRADAEAARSRLTAANIDADNVRIVDQSDASSMGGSSSYGSSSTMDTTSTTGLGSSSGMGGSSSDGSSGSSTTGSGMTGSGTTGDHSSHGGGFLNSLKNMFVPDEDRHSYNEGIRRGGSLLYADVDEDDVDRAIQILEETSSVDMDERERSWRSEGWAGYSPSTSTAGASTTGTANYAANTGTTGTTGNEERIQLAEEQMVVGKREVNRGGARIRSYVVERPVQEQVTLREEHVNIERRPVSGTTTGTADASALFQERTVEMTETAEEAVVGKQARVTEELVVSKTADQHTETIQDTVRKTEVEIDENAGTAGSGTSRSGSAIGGLGASKDRDRY
ncbi:MAG: hypothetical protein AVDCRST_MAG91-1856 [uncultured Sphingomonadaceae bacterium]|uniref:DUF2382 domain-containing protein n=1 Tax=uncultured Sphingomonadaceae bacterium TaxID=169976 RepID=A0A6J4T784_9SPHN|nr:MAG: hypothetical protein AVDCRST_MAG91-1856 [uncultured Sphingomonadaceae bacterium]